jgi:hypothetical protein
MIDQNGFCHNCRCYHYHNYLYSDGCPNPFVPLERPWQPSTEEQHARKMLQIDAEIYQENCERQREQERRERKATLEKAKVQQMFREHDQQEKAAREQATAKTLALMADMRKDLLMPVKATRQANRLGEREQEARQKRAAEQAPAQRQAGRLAQRAGQRGGR